MVYKEIFIDLNFQILRLVVSDMEVKSFKIQDSFYCIWFEREYFHIEDVDFRNILKVSKLQLEWFMEAITNLVKEPEWKFFLENRNEGRESARLTKFRTRSGWLMRYVARKGYSNFSFIHIFSSDSKKGWLSFLYMIKDFLLIHKYEQWHSSLQHDSLKTESRPPPKLPGFKLCDKVKGAMRNSQSNIEEKKSNFGRKALGPKIRRLH